MDEPKSSEILLRDNSNWLHFTNPQQIIVAEKLDDVLPALKEIDQHVEQDGWYAAGFLSYEAAPAFDSALPSRPPTGFPYLWFGLYPQPRTADLPQPTRPKEILDWHPTINHETYNAAVEKIKESIADGRTYQVNYTIRLQAAFHSSAWDFFLHLAQTQNQHAAYIDTGRFIICSASPELFFQLAGDEIVCRPMKGTVKRGRTTLEDQKQCQWLMNSEKNRAENVMIVDMIRNDLGRIAKTGSIYVSALFNVERYPTLWQMTSTVTAKTNAPLTEIFGALFPCASITGAPKVSTMRIIDQLETSARNVYTGTIGYFSPQRKAKFNVAIRTAFIARDDQKAEYGVGGGIVWDSTSIDEYNEALLKAGVLIEPQLEFSLLETILWTPQEGFFLREEHIDRLLDSANYFDFPIPKERIEKELKEIESTFSSPQRVRLLLDQQGELQSASHPYHAVEKILRVSLAEKPVDSHNIYLFHKTTYREIYEIARANFPECDDVLLYNQHGELTEFTIGNLVVEINGEFITPPIKCGVLAGTFRGHLVETGQVVERTISISQLEHCTQIFRVNSIRKWEQAQMSK